MSATAVGMVIEMKTGEIQTKIEFNRPKKYTTVRVLGRGACGETVLVHDEDMGIDLVVKKYSPVISGEEQPVLFRDLIGRFRDEARILFQLNHPNVVRVFNYFDYGEFNTAYILMEYIHGRDIESYIREEPLHFDYIFEKLVDGFYHLESRGVLHRDIRPSNIMVSTDGEPKIIDFGFGKQLEIDLGPPGKSISLNWWCEVPPEFSDSIYDAQTEVYFVGKLFEHLASIGPVAGSKHLKTIARMALKNKVDRFQTFREISRSMNEERFEEIDFSEGEIDTYRRFVGQLNSAFSQISPNASYVQNPEAVIDGLNNVYRAVMLEVIVPEPVNVCRVFVSGEYKYFRGTEIHVSSLERFISFFRQLSDEKREIVLANIASRLDTVKRMEVKTNFDIDFEEEIPF